MRVLWRILNAALLSDSRRQIVPQLADLNPEHCLMMISIDTTCRVVELLRFLRKKQAVSDHQLKRREGPPRSVRIGLQQNLRTNHLLAAPIELLHHQKMVTLRIRQTNDVSLLHKSLLALSA